MKVKNTDRMRKIQEKYTLEIRLNAVETKDMKEAAAAFQRMNAQLKGDLKERDLHNQAKDILSAAVYIS